MLIGGIKSDPFWNPHLLHPSALPHYLLKKLLWNLSILRLTGNDISHVWIRQYIGSTSECARCGLLQRNRWTGLFCGVIGHPPGWGADALFLDDVGLEAPNAAFEC